MYFLPRNNAFYSRIVYIKPLYRYVFTGVALVAIIGIWFFAVHGMLNIQRAHTYAEIKRLREKELIIKDLMYLYDFLPKGSLFSDFS